MKSTDESPQVQADFNGLFGDVLCISHGDTCLEVTGNPLHLREGMRLTAFQEDADEHGNPDALIASGTVEKSPEWLRCKGSRWVLRIDERGVKHQSEIRHAS